MRFGRYGLGRMRCPVEASRVRSNEAFDSWHARSARTAAGCRCGSATRTIPRRRIRFTVRRAVLLAYRDWNRGDDPAAIRAVSWLLTAQQADGGWDGAAKTREPDSAGGRALTSGIEETALAVESLVSFARSPAVQVALRRGAMRLVAAVEAGTYVQPAPIGFYFAKLWYYERLYPRIFTLAALGRLLRTLQGD